MLNAVSLFSGAGGADLGFEQEGFNILFANDIWDVACATYRHNLTDVIQPGALEYVPPYVWHDLHAVGVQVVFGGPPCQSFSLARTKAAKSFNDHSGLRNVADMKSVVDCLKPEIFICENVVNIKSNLETFMYFMDWPEYRVVCYRLNSLDYGLPQRRERLFFVGVHRDLNICFREPEKSPCDHGWADCIGESYDYVMLKRSNARTKEALKPWEPAYTVTGGDQSIIVHKDQFVPHTPIEVQRAMGINSRRITPRECARLQGFPDEFMFAGNKQNWYVQIGNAWSVPVARAIAREVKRCLIGRK
jgi:DNA (cytosine-5)-methyltransferase 1